MDNFEEFHSLKSYWQDSIS